jgi:hypothetical protein
MPNPKMPCLECLYKANMIQKDCPKGCDRLLSSDWAKVMSERLDKVKVDEKFMTRARE